MLFHTIQLSPAYQYLPDAVFFSRLVHSLCVAENLPGYQAESRTRVSLFMKPCPAVYTKPVKSLFALGVFIFVLDFLELCINDIRLLWLVTRCLCAGIAAFASGTGLLGLHVSIHFFTQLLRDSGKR